MVEWRLIIKAFLKHESFKINDLSYHPPSPY